MDDITNETTRAYFDLAADAARWRAFAPYIDDLIHDLESNCGCISTWLWVKLLNDLRGHTGEPEHPC